MVEAFGLSDPGCVRKNNEDYFGIDPAAGLYLLADGMGGAQAGETASRLSVETVQAFLKAKPDPNLDTLVESFREANRKVLHTASSEPRFNGMGTTLVGVWESGEELLIASVGDSRAYMMEDDGLKAVTEDQTWANEVGRKLGLDEDRMKTHPMRHVLTMAIGVESPLRINSYTIRPAEGAQFLLCSDGLHGVVPGKALAEELGRNASQEDRCRRLIQMARFAGGPDNITVVLLRYSTKSS
ncbi:MAG: serine/threonine-protein phosphatase [Acidobacteriia bacterium]|nr:serine/threonine-protein phosphatase [Terriglobia bacterium]